MAIEYARLSTAANAAKTERGKMQQSTNGVAYLDSAQSPVQVCWLPSLPLTQKQKAPPICGLGILYSEDLDQILQVFETDNLKQGVKGFSRDQAAALNIDPNCRVYWMEINNSQIRAQTKLELVTQMQTQASFR